MNYVYLSHFQPFNNEHLKTLGYLIGNKLENDDKIVIGILLPNPSNKLFDDDEMARRYAEKTNLLSYYQRFELINNVLKHNNWNEKIAAIVPIPHKPSKSIVAVENFLPPKNERTMCVTHILESESEHNRIDSYATQEEEFFIIPAHNFEDKIRIIFPELITCLIAIGRNNWKKLIPECNIALLSNYRFGNNVKEKFSFHDAKVLLKRKHLEMPKESLRKELEKLLPKDFFNDELEDEEDEPVDNKKLAATAH